MYNTTCKTPQADSKINAFSKSRVCFSSQIICELVPENHTMKKSYFLKPITELQIRGGIEDNSNFLFPNENIWRFRGLIIENRLNQNVYVIYVCLMAFIVCCAKLSGSLPKQEALQACLLHSVSCISCTVYDCGFIHTLITLTIYDNNLNYLMPCKILSKNI